MSIASLWCNQQFHRSLRWGEKQCTPVVENTPSKNCCTRKKYVQGIHFKLEIYEGCTTSQKWRKTTSNYVTLCGRVFVAVLRKSLFLSWVSAMHCKKACLIKPIS